MSFKAITIALVFVSMVQAFAPPGSYVSKTRVQTPSVTQINGLFGEEGERKTLTRDNEPEEFFAT